MSQQMCFYTEEDFEKSILACSFDATFGRPKLPNRRIPVNDQAAPYYQVCARKPCSDFLRVTYAVAAKYPIGYSKNMDEATRKAKFLDFCSLAQIIQYKHDDLEEWEREMALEKHVLYQRKTLDDPSFFKWVQTHDQIEIEYKLSRNKAVLDNRNAEEERKAFQCTIFEAQIQSAAHTKQLAKAEDQKGSLKTIKPRIELNNYTKRQEAENSKRNSEESDSPKARSAEEIRQELLKKVRTAAAKRSKSIMASPSEPIPTPPIAPSVSVSATPWLSPPAVLSSSKSVAPTQTFVSNSAIPPNISAGPPSLSRSLSASPSTKGTSGASASTGPASPHHLSTPYITPPSTRQVSPPEASSATATPSKPPAVSTSSALAMSGQDPFNPSPSRPSGGLPPLPIASVGPPQSLPFTQQIGPRHRPTPPEWVYPLSLCTLIISNMPYVPIRDSEARMPPTETVLMLPHTSILRMLAAAMHVHPSLLFQQCPLPLEQDRPREADAKEIEYLIYGLRAWWHAIFPKPTTKDEACARIIDMGYAEEPLREAFARAEKAEIKLMAKMVWGLVRERQPGNRLTWEAGETVREWLGWERGELGFWD